MSAWPLVHVPSGKMRTGGHPAAAPAALPRSLSAAAALLRASGSLRSTKIVCTAIASVPMIGMCFTAALLIADGAS